MRAPNAADALNKGDNAVIIGNLSQNAWDDKETGKKQYKTVLQAETIAKDTKFRTATSDPASQFGKDIPEDELPY